ncbi:PD-(D/E)XK motif protein [Cystobacter fuscus]|uniref:PD-(D/E)XK motif protein n=1 Tax=Cystobacter fuscus TaxID=43 RepID=UPI0037C09F2D
MTSVESAWALIAGEPKTAPGLVARRVHPEACVELHAGLDRPSDMPMVCMHVTAGAARQAEVLPTSAGFMLHQESNVRPGPNGVRLSLHLTTSRYRDVFGVLAQDVVDSVARAPNQRTAVSTFIERLRRWQGFLEQHGPAGLDEFAQRGLYGELWFLRHHAIPLVGSGPAVSSWTGPDRSNQDFQFPECAVEVKTTSSGPHHSVTVSNIRQLDETHVPVLLLFHVGLEVHKEAGETLVGMVEALRSMLRPDNQPLSLFEERLRESGYLDIHAPVYGSSSYTIRTHRFYRVTDGFPRLTEADLPDGVGSVRYSISLSACAPYRIATDEANTSILGEGRCP